MTEQVTTNPNAAGEFWRTTGRHRVALNPNSETEQKDWLVSPSLSSTKDNRF